MSPANISELFPKLQADRPSDLKEAPVILQANGSFFKGYLHFVPGAAEVEVIPRLGMDQRPLGEIQKVPVAEFLGEKATAVVFARSGN
jgi:hypothetical protein